MSCHELHLRSGARIAVHDSGTGPLMVLISGLGGTAAFWQPIHAHFAASHRVISFDQPGCGKAPATDAPVTVDLLAAMTGEMLAAVAPGIAPAVMVGHSTGGAIAQAFLHGHHGERPARLVLSGTWARACAYMRSLFEVRIRSLGADFDGDIAAYAALTWLLGVTPSDVVTPYAAAAPFEDRPRAATQVARMRALLAFDGTPMLSGLDLPSLILGAEDDRIVPPYHQRELAGLIPGAQLRILPDGGHFYPQSRSGDVISTVEGFLAAA